MSMEHTTHGISWFSAATLTSSRAATSLRRPARPAGTRSPRIRRLEVGEPPPVQALAASAQIVRTFVEDYHEQVEERYVFPSGASRPSDGFADVVTQVAAAEKKLGIYELSQFTPRG